MPLIQPRWPIEPTTLYVISYYATNAINQEPTYTSNLLQTYNEAEQAAKDKIETEGNVGVCIIQPITCSIVYPAIEWEAF